MPRRSIAAGQEARTTVKLTATKAGVKTIAAKFYSREMNDVDGFFNVQVRGGVGEPNDG